MEKSASANSLEEGSDMDDQPSLMAMYSKQVGGGGGWQKREISDTPPDTPPMESSNNQSSIQAVYHDNPSVSVPSQQEFEVESVVLTSTSAKTGFISQS